MTKSALEIKARLPTTNKSTVFKCDHTNISFGTKKILEIAGQKYRNW